MHTEIRELATRTCATCSGHACISGYKGSLVQSSEFRLWDSERDVEHLAVQCGGWRRPFTVRLHSSHNYTVALLKEQSIRIVRRLCAPAAPADAVAEPGAETSSAGPGGREAASLLQGHHGRIVLACECLPLGSDCVAAVSASEDGTVRALIFRCASGPSASLISWLPHCLSECTPVAAQLRFTTHDAVGKADGCVGGRVEEGGRRGTPQR